MKQSSERNATIYYTDNYVSLVPGQSKTISIEAATADLKGEAPLVMLDGWNVSTANTGADDLAIGNNTDALATSVPAHDFKNCPGQ